MDQCQTERTKRRKDEGFQSRTETKPTNTSNYLPNYSNPRSNNDENSIFKFDSKS